MILYFWLAYPCQVALPATIILALVGLCIWAVIAHEETDDFLWL